MKGEHGGAHPARFRERIGAVSTTRVDDDLTRAEAALCTEGFSQVDEGVVGNREHYCFRPSYDVLGGQHRYPGQQAFGSTAGGFGDAGHGDDGVTRALQADR